MPPARRLYVRHPPRVAVHLLYASGMGCAWIFSHAPTTALQLPSDSSSRATWMSLRSAWASRADTTCIRVWGLGAYAVQLDLCAVHHTIEPDAASPAFAYPAAAQCMGSCKHKAEE